jgi:hypothetical protein
MSNYEYEYYNLSVNNIDSETSDATAHEPNLTFYERRQSSIIENCSDWDIAIDNFKMDLKTLPQFIPTIRANFNSSLTTEERDTTIYSIGLEYKHTDGIRYTAFSQLIFSPQDRTIQQPGFISGYPNYKSNYYNIYNYEWFIAKMLNPAIIEATNKLKEVLTSYGISNTFITNDVPYFTFDKASGIVNVLSPASMYNGFNNGNGDPFLAMMLNTPLYRLFNSLPFTLQSETFKTLDDSSNKISKTTTAYKLNMSNFNMSTVISESNPPQINGSISSTKSDYLSIYQDYSTFDSWSPVESIVMTTSTIPVNPSQKSANHSFINGVETTKGSANVTELEITDFKSGEYSGGIIYTPTSKRWINLNHKEELTDINVAVFYRNKLDGNLIPIRINSGGNFSMKIVFRKLRN